ncbi:hypothetical protein OPT61_g2244 [Boeremia exigua]|uniref:Uncharacterized protein n=1 Tax=Boeremia exigua TaxID=749465 RepID=A0ACC2IMD1_9PLEO|nr:hypothetical protein OPT61_g2244 [Boeremia exigua]
MKSYKRRPGACDGAIPSCENCKANEVHCEYLPLRKRGRRAKPTQKPVENASLVNLLDHEMSTQSPYTHRRSLSDTAWSTELTSPLATGDDNAPSPLQDLGFDAAFTLESHDLGNMISPIGIETFYSIEHDAAFSFEENATLIGFENLNPCLEELFSWTEKCLLETLQGERVIYNRVEEENLIETPWIPVSQNEREECLTMYYRKLYLEVSYMEKGMLENLFHDFGQDCVHDPAKTALLYAVTAVGARSLWTSQGDAPKNMQHHTIARQHYRGALELLGQDANRRPGLATVQLVFAFRWVSGDVDKLLALTVACVQTLALNTRSGVSALCQGHGEEDVMKGFWLLYAIEKPHRMRTGQFSLLDDNAIDFLPWFLQQKAKKAASTFPSACYFARICSLTMQRLYGQEGQRLPFPLLEKTSSHLEMFLVAWKNEQQVTLDCNTLDALPLRISPTIHYYELLLCIRGARLSRSSGTSTEDHELSGIMHAAKEIFQTLGGINPQSVSLNPYDIPPFPAIFLGRATIIAYCNLAAFIQTVPDQVELLRLLGSTLGLFARLPGLSNGSFERVSMVFAETQRSMKEFDKARAVGVDSADLSFGQLGGSSC